MRLLRGGRGMSLGTTVGAVALLVPGVTAQTTSARIMEQDPSANNLIDPPDYRPGALGELGRVDRAGAGARQLILIPGLGFGGDVLRAVAAAFEGEYTTHSVTLPGFGGTPAPPSPPAGTSFGEQTWTDGALRALVRLVDEAGTGEVVVVGHWLTGTQLAIRLARARPERVRAVVLLAGAARFVLTDPDARAPATLAERVAGVDEFMAPRWFKTVTRETWDDNNFLPSDYASDPVVGLRLWRQAARPPLHVWVRYLNEFYAQDTLLDLPHVRAPILLLQPGLEGAYRTPGNDYLEAYTRSSWGDAPERLGAITVSRVPGARLVMWADQPDLVARAMRDFLATGSGPLRPS